MTRSGLCIRWRERQQLSGATSLTALILMLLPATVGLAQVDPALTVVGETRTVDPEGEPRLWGRGRPHTAVYTWDDSAGAPCRKDNVIFGLSRHGVDWGSAADACPKGTWVSGALEMNVDAPCDTNRPDGEEDWLDCSGNAWDAPAAGHRGWALEAYGWSPILGREVSEGGGWGNDWETCNSLPVWCCRYADAGGDAELTVGGEVRSVDQADEPRLWGRGRGDNVLVAGPEDGVPPSRDLPVQAGLVLP